MVGVRSTGARTLEFRDVPRALWMAMLHDLEVLRDPRRSTDSVSGQLSFTHVKRQGGKPTPHFRGFAVQLWDGREKRLQRIALVADSRVGAVLAIAALADPHLRSQHASHAWMASVMEDPQFLLSWLASVKPRLGTLVRHGTHVFFPEP